MDRGEKMNFEDDVRVFVIPENDYELTDVQLIWVG